MKEKVLIGLIGVTLDAMGKGSQRWHRWRPTVSLFQQEDLLFDRFELIGHKRHLSIMESVEQDIMTLSPETEVHHHIINFQDPWDFEEVFERLHEFATNYPFNPEEEEYYLHITTGTHVAQICLYLLAETHYFPAYLIQSSPGKRGEGTYQIIDLDLSRYDRIATRFDKEHVEGAEFLKAGIETKNENFNRMIEQIEQVAIRSSAPILLTGPTGAGKTALARRIFQLKQHRRQVKGAFVEVNCATIRGDGAMSALFGHVKGAFTGAMSDRKGLLRTADQGLLFLDEVGELGIDEQTMLLRAIEEKRFLPVGSDREVSSDFQLIAGTNRDLREEVRNGRFREDLLARINLWVWEMPALRERPEDIEPNLNYELTRFSEKEGRNISINREARELFLKFALSPSATWQSNFRDLNACVTRMATLAPKGRINIETVRDEIERLKWNWAGSEQDKEGELNYIRQIVGKESEEGLDLFDRVQLNEVLKVCMLSKTLSEAGRTLFAQSRTRKKNPNDADRLKKYLAKFGINWEMI